jgi:Icc-related predicted phosphoesterase
LPPEYLDFLMSTLSAPLVHVLGNHCSARHDPVTGRCDPAAYQGAYNLNGVVAEYEGLLLAGAEGSPWYNGGPHQYTDQQMTVNLLKLVPGLLRNKVQTGRYLDVMVTHAPPKGTHDNPDIAHRGFASLVPFIERFHPALLLHGHTHRYEPMLPIRSRLGQTEVINAFGHVILELARADIRSGWRVVNPGVSEVNYG